MVDTYITEVSQDTWIFFPWDMALQYVQPFRDGLTHGSCQSARRCTAVRGRCVKAASAEALAAWPVLRQSRRAVGWLTHQIARPDDMATGSTASASRRSSISTRSICCAWRLKLTWCCSGAGTGPIRPMASGGFVLPAATGLHASFLLFCRFDGDDRLIWRNAGGVTARPCCRPCQPEGLPPMIHAPEPRHGRHRTAPGDGGAALARRASPSRRPPADQRQPGRPGGQPALGLRQALADAALNDPAAHLYGPVLGLPALREEIAHAMVGGLWRARSPPDQVAITQGCNQAFTAVMSTLAGPGDEVILPTPWYFNHKMWLDMAGRHHRAAGHRGHGLIPDGRGGGGADHAAHPRHRAGQPEQPRRRGIPGRNAAPPSATLPARMALR